MMTCFRLTLVVYFSIFSVIACGQLTENGLYSKEAPDEYSTDFARAEFSRVHKAALDGDIAAQLELAHYYRDGYGTDRNLDQAKFWYTACGMVQWSGQAYALNMAALVYEDQSKLFDAYTLFLLSSLAAGEPVEGNHLNRLREQLSMDEIQRANVRAEELANATWLAVGVGE